MNSGMTVEKPSSQITEAGDLVPPATAKYASPKPGPRSQNDLGPTAQRLAQIQAAFRWPVGPRLRSPRQPHPRGRVPAPPPQLSPPARQIRDPRAPQHARPGK